jgi:transcriptional regulator with XRE-family HTH domain
MAVKARRKRFVYKDQRSVTKDDMEIGWRIRMRRVELKVSQRQLGKALGVTFQQVQKYETGMNRISGSRFVEICRLLQVDPNYLFGWPTDRLSSMKRNRTIP